MEQNEMITVPFDVRLAKGIQAGIVKGNIRTKHGVAARILCLGKIKLVNGSSTIVNEIVSQFYNENSREEEIHLHNQQGEVKDTLASGHDYDLVIDIKRSELPFIEKFIYSA